MPRCAGRGWLCERQNFGNSPACPHRAEDHTKTGSGRAGDRQASAFRGNLRNCHWPQNFNGVRLRVFSKFADDEKNTPSETVLLMLTGGNKFAGIHGAHLGPGVRIRYAATDATRQTIPWVEYRNTTTGDGQIFASSDSSVGFRNQPPNL